MGKLVWATALFCLLAGLYLFFAGSVDAVEAIAMVVCAAVATALAVAMATVAKRSFVLLPPAKAVVNPIAALLPEFVVVGRELIAGSLRGGARMRGDFSQQPFDPGSDTPSAAGRRALTIIGMSLAPRSFVIRGERSETLILHGLPKKPASADRSWPA